MSNDDGRCGNELPARCRRWLRPFLLLVLSSACGCRPAPQVPAANLVYSAALRTATNTKSPKRLRAAREMIVRDHGAGLIAADEYATYLDIMAAAEAGKWAEAERAALRFRRDQVR